MKNYGIGVLKDGVIVKVQPRSEARYILPYAARYLNQTDPLEDGGTYVVVEIAEMELSTREEIADTKLALAAYDGEEELTALLRQKLELLQIQQTLDILDGGDRDRL